MQHANEAKPLFATTVPAPHRSLAAIALWVAASLTSHSASNACPPGPDLGASLDDGGLSSAQRAHPDSQFAADNQGPYLGDAWREADGGSPEISFPSSGVTLRSWLPLDEFDPTATDGTDCWGYTAPSAANMRSSASTPERASPRSEPRRRSSRRPSSRRAQRMAGHQDHQHHAYIVVKAAGGSRSTTSPRSTTAF